MGLTTKYNRNLDKNSGVPPELRNSINDLFNDYYGNDEDDEDEPDKTLMDQTDICVGLVPSALDGDGQEEYCQLPEKLTI